MALMTCPECNKKISDAAISCPYCGYPVAEHREQRGKVAAKESKPTAIILKNAKSNSNIFLTVFIISLCYINIWMQLSPANGIATFGPVLYRLLITDLPVACFIMTVVYGAIWLLFRRRVLRQLPIKYRIRAYIGFWGLVAVIIALANNISPIIPVGFGNSHERTEFTAAARAVGKELKSIRARLETGIQYREYIRVVGDLNAAIAQLPTPADQECESFLERAKHATEDYKTAMQAWRDKLDTRDKSTEDKLEGVIQQNWTQGGVDVDEAIAKLNQLER